MLNSRCGPDSKYVYQIFNNDTSKYFTFKGYPLDGYDIANPCGLTIQMRTKEIPHCLGSSIWLRG